MSEENIHSRWFKPENFKNVLKNFIGTRECNIYIESSVAILDKSDLTLYFPCTIDSEKKKLGLSLENILFQNGAEGIKRGKVFLRDNDDSELGLFLAGRICEQFHQYFGVELSEGTIDITEAFHTRIVLDYNIDSISPTTYFYITFLVECDSISHIKQKENPLSNFFSLDSLKYRLTNEGDCDTHHYMKHLHVDEFYNCIEVDNSLEGYEMDQDYFEFVGHVLNKLVLGRKILGEEK